MRSSCNKLRTAARAQIGRRFMPPGAPVPIDGKGGGAWIPHHLSSTVINGHGEPAGIVERVLAQHRDQDTQPAIDTTPEGPVVRGTRRVMLHTGPPPVVRRPT